jgi:hypothetical protein
MSGENDRDRGCRSHDQLQTLEHVRAARNLLASDERSRIPSGTAMG